MTADHGSGHGKKKTTANVAQRANPTLLLSVPLAFGNGGGKDAAARLHATLARNQNRITTHWDLHETLLAWAGAGADDVPVADSSYCAGGRCRWIQATRPTKKHVPWPFAVRLDRNLVPVNRTCKEARAAENFCFCALASTYAEPADKLRSRRYRSFVPEVINAVNEFTGNGKFACAQLDPDDFHLTKLVRGTYGGAPMFATIARKDGSKKPSYTANLRKGKVLRSPNQYKQPRMPEIMRDDRFDAEPCLGDTGEDRHPPLFKDAAGGPQLLKRGKYSAKWNLRWCSCKKE